MLMLYCGKCKIEELHNYLQFEQNYYDFQNSIIFVINPSKKQIKEFNLTHINPFENKSIAIPSEVAKWIEKIFSETVNQDIDIPNFQNEFQKEIEKVILERQFSKKEDEN